MGWILILTLTYEDMKKKEGREKPLKIVSLDEDERVEGKENKQRVRKVSWVTILPSTSLKSCVHTCCDLG